MTLADLRATLGIPDDLTACYTSPREVRMIAVPVAAQRERCGDGADDMAWPGPQKEIAMRIAMLILAMCAVTACAVDTVDLTATTDQSLCAVEQCDEWGTCITILTGCGSTTGGEDTSGGGGGTGGGCSIVDINGNCLSPNVGSCLSQQACDPTLTPDFRVDPACVGACGNTTAKCYPIYRCGRDPSCPEAHYGYCGVF